MKKDIKFIKKKVKGLVIEKYYYAFSELIQDNGSIL